MGDAERPFGAVCFFGESVEHGVRLRVELFDEGAEFGDFVWSDERAFVVGCGPFEDAAVGVFDDRLLEQVGGAVVGLFDVYGELDDRFVRGGDSEHVFAGLPLPGWHDDLFDYLHSVFNSNSMHQELKTELADAYNYLFLGLPFEKWYLQLLLRVLSLHTDKLKSLERFASRPEAPTEKGLFEEQFNIEFVPDQAPAFIEELYRHCEGRGLLRPLPEQSGHGTVEAAFAKIQKWIARADIQKAMEELKGLLEPYRPRSEELLRELLLLMSSYQNLEKQSQLGIDGPEAGKEKNRIIYALLSLMDEAKKLT